jgi:hypothetical protein
MGMSITRQNYFDRLTEFVENTSDVTCTRIKGAYYKNSIWLRKRGLEKPLEDMYYAFCDVKLSLQTNGITSELAELAKVCQAKAEFFSKESYKQEDCFNPTLDQSFTKVLGHTFTITEYLSLQADFMARAMRSVAEYYEEGMNA